MFVNLKVDSNNLNVFLHFLFAVLPCDHGVVIYDYEFRVQKYPILNMLST